MASADDIEAAQRGKLLGYWENRAQARVLATDRTEEAVNREVLQAYASTTNAIEGELRAFYERFATESGLTPEAARATLSVRERADFRADLAAKQEAIRALPGPLSEQLQAYLDDLGEASKLRKVTRQQRLLLDLEHELSGMSARVESRLETGMSKAFEQRYEGNAKDLAKVPAFRAELGAPAPRLLEQATTEKWLGQNFSDRIWDDKDKLVGELRRILSQAAVSHSGIEALTKKMARAMGSSLDNARRLVRTELNYVANQATLEGYRQSGVKRYKFLAAIDSRTSELCRMANGQVYAVAEAAVGVNFPPLHPNCRSTTVAAFTEEDLAERYDFSDVQLSDEELAALGVTREEYLEATGQVKPGAKPIALSKREAQRAEDALSQAPIEGESLRVNGRLDRLGEDLRFERELEQTLDKGEAPHTPATIEVRNERLKEFRPRIKGEEARVVELEDRVGRVRPKAEAKEPSPRSKAMPKLVDELALVPFKATKKKRSAVDKTVDAARSSVEKLKGVFNGLVRSLWKLASRVFGRVTISSRRGDPESIYDGLGRLSKPQEKLLLQLQEPGDTIAVRKRDASLRDISALTAHEHVEFALFTRKGERMVVRGARSTVPIGPEDAARLARQGWRWSGHSHPGTHPSGLEASDRDRIILKAFDQVSSVVVNSVGEFKQFWWDPFKWFR